MVILDFFKNALNLKNISRQGWIDKLSIKYPESVADHSYSMAMMAMVISDLENYDSEKILKMVLLHDLAESKIGDFMPEQIGYDKKSELENYAMSEILESLPQKIQEDYTSIWNEFLVRDTPESKLVHELDKLEMALQAKIYEKDTDPEKVKPFIISAVEQIMDPDVKKILMDILK